MRLCSGAAEHRRSVAVRTWIVVILAVLLAGGGSGTAGAQSRAEVRRQVETSLVAEGTIDITADGLVLDHALKRPDELPKSVVEMIARTVRQWRFEPVVLNPGTTRARAPMSIRLVAKKLDDGRFTVELRGAQFGTHAPAETVKSVRLTPPRYPDAAAHAGVGGTVYVVLRVGRDGRVADLVAEQVNLRALARERDMEDWRKTLARAALGAARSWTFEPPKQGDDVDAEYWAVRIPVDFVAPGQRAPAEHEWHAYVPGPRAAIPWATDSSSADALAAGSVHPIGRGLRLMTSNAEG
jgi:hypothetical protein